MIHFSRSLFAFTFAVSLLAGGAAVLSADGDSGEQLSVKIRLGTDAGSDAVEIVDLEELAVGESRSLTSESGKTVTVTRDGDGYAVDLGGKTLRLGDHGDLLAEPGHRLHRMKRIEIGDDGETEQVIVRRSTGGEELLHVEPGHSLHRMKRIEIDGDGEKTFLLSGDPQVHRMIVRESKDGEHGFAFVTGDSAPGFLFAGPRLVDRLEKNEKFLALDEATRDIVRDIVREASAPMQWIERDDEDGERIEIFVERREKKSDDRD